MNDPIPLPLALYQIVVNMAFNDLFFINIDFLTIHSIKSWGLHMQLGLSFPNINIEV
jgi:hypothetical protein